MAQVPLGGTIIPNINAFPVLPKAAVTTYVQGAFVVYDSGGNFTFDVIADNEVPDAYVRSVTKQPDNTTIDFLGVEPIGYRWQWDWTYDSGAAPSLAGDVKGTSAGITLLKAGGGTGTGKVIAKDHVTGKCVVWLP